MAGNLAEIGSNSLRKASQRVKKRAGTGLLAGFAALWATLALTVAMVVTPMDTMQMIERQGIWGLGTALRQGSAVVLGVVLPGREAVR